MPASLNAERMSHTSGVGEGQCFQKDAHELFHGSTPVWVLDVLKNYAEKLDRALSNTAKNEVAAWAVAGRAGDWAPREIVFDS
jgi:hypothetical protein